MTNILVCSDSHGRAAPGRFRASARLKNYAAGEIVTDGIIRYQPVEEGALCVLQTLGGWAVILVGRVAIETAILA